MNGVKRLLDSFLIEPSMSVKDMESMLKSFNETGFYFNSTEIVDCFDMHIDQKHFAVIRDFQSQRDK